MFVFFSFHPGYRDSSASDGVCFHVLNSVFMLKNETAELGIEFEFEEIKKQRDFS